MAKFKIKPTGQFKKDLKRYKYDQGKLDDLQKVLDCLEETGVVPKDYKPHQLFGNYKGFLECHVQEDFLLIWIDKEKPLIKLVRIGSHSELFKK